MSIKAFVIAAVLVITSTQAGAVEPSEMLDDPVMEARARTISAELRCVVCQNQSIDDSNAELARDMRVLVRERLVAGNTNQQVLDYVVSRYGDYVLLKPPFKSSTYLLWFGPLLFVMIGLTALVLMFRRGQSQDMDNAMSQSQVLRLSKDEEKRLEKLLAESDHEKNGDTL
jgi:cytochrome c-type biogenesis protein CcmH